MHERTKRVLRPFYPHLFPFYSFFHRHFITPRNIRCNQKKTHRMLEIGPGAKRLKGFETLNVIAGLEVDYALDASDKLPFKSKSFDLIHASHVLEHIPWHRLRQTVNEWTRILKPGGSIEIWVPDGFKLCHFFCDLDNKINNNAWHDGWNLNGLIDDPYLWANGRLLYGTRDDYPSWHKSIITPGFLENLLKNAGMIEVRRMDPLQVRGYDHGWINLGIQGIKP